MSQTTVDNFVTVVSIGTREKEVAENINFDSSSSGYVTVLTIGDDENKKSIKDVTEEVIVYRLPGERLGFGLKFEGGTKASEFVKRLFIQSCAPDSPASRVNSSWGKLTEGDEVLEIDSAPVNTMTRIDCVRCLKDSNVAIKLLLRHTYQYETKNKPEVPPLIICAEEKRVPPPPPPVPPRKISRKLLKTLNNPAKELLDTTDSNKQKKLQSYNSPDVARRDRRFSDGSLGPPDAEVYVDLFLQESTQSLSESDDTGSTISTVIDRLSSFPTTTTSSFSGSLPSTPTAVQRQLDISNVNIYDEDDIMIMSKGLGKHMPLPREENNNIILDYINPLCFQDAPLSYGNESTKVIVPDEIDNVKEDPILLEESEPALKKPPVPPRSRDLHTTSDKTEEKRNVENLPRLVDFVPKFLNGVKEPENSKEVMKMFLENERYKTDFDYYDREDDNADNYTNGVDLYSSKWSLSSQLATIGEVEEEGISEFNFNRADSTPVVIVENIDKPDTEDIQVKNEGTNGSMANLPSESRQPPDGHEFPDFIENHNESPNQNYYTEKEIHTTTFNADFSNSIENHPVEEFPNQNNLLSNTSVSTSNSVLSSKMYESTEDLKFDDFIPESYLLHSRSQSLIDMSALAKQKNTKWNQMFEQRRKGLSKLKGLVIPEASESDFSSNVNIPEIKSQTTTAAVYLSMPKLDDSFHGTEVRSSSHTDLLKSSMVIPSWSSNSPSNLPKYSPAFKRKSLQVFPTSISKSETSDYSTNVDFPKYCDKGSPKGNKINDDDLNPPKSLESISSPTRSDCSFDYVSSTKKCNKSADFFHKTSSGKTEDESDNDSAVSSSQSSYNSRYSPPSSPTTSCELNNYSKKLEEDDKNLQNRLLKPSSVEAINRKNILASAKCRSGKDVKIGSPVIRRKQEDAQSNGSTKDIIHNGREKEEELVSTEPLPNEKPPIIPVPLEKSVSLESSSSEEKTSTGTLKSKGTNPTNDESIKPPKEVLHVVNTTPPQKISTKSIFLTSVPDTATKRLSKIPETKPKHLLNNNPKSRKPPAINVKALKENFENLTSVPIMSQKVPVSKPIVPKRNLDTVVTSVNNGVIRDHKNEKVEVSVPLQQRKYLNKPLDVETKIIVLKNDINGNSLGISLAGGIDEKKGITINRIKYSSIAYADGRLKKGDKIVSVNGKFVDTMTHQEAVDLFKEQVSEFSILIEEGNVILSPPTSTNSRRTSSIPVHSESKFTSSEIIETKKANHVITITKDGAGLGFSIEGGKDSPQGDVPLLVKKIFTGGAAEKSGLLKVGDQVLQVNDIRFTKLTRIEAWNIMKKIPDGKVNIHIYR